jgi:hypothetical protein
MQLVHSRSISSSVGDPERVATLEEVLNQDSLIVEMHQQRDLELHRLELVHLEQTLVQEIILNRLLNIGKDR